MGVRLGGASAPVRKGVTPTRRGFSFRLRRRPPLTAAADAPVRGEGRAYLDALGRVVSKVRGR